MTALCCAYRYRFPNRICACVFHGSMVDHLMMTNSSRFGFVSSQSRHASGKTRFQNSRKTLTLHDCLLETDAFGFGKTRHQMRVGVVAHDHQDYIESADSSKYTYQKALKEKHLKSELSKELKDPTSNQPKKATQPPTYCESLSFGREYLFRCF